MNELITTLNDVASLWVPQLLTAAWQGGLALLIVWLLIRCTRRLPGHMQCWLWRLAFAKLLLACIWVSPIELPWLPPEPPVRQLRIAPTQPQQLFDHRKPSPPVTWKDDLIEAETVTASAKTVTPATPRPRLTRLGWLAIGWLTIVMLLSVRLLKQTIGVRRQLARLPLVTNTRLRERLGKSAEQFRLKRLPNVRSSSTADSPYLCGVWRPTIVLPSFVTETATDEQLDTVLAHELAHIKRHDLLWNWLPALCELLFCFHPLIWLARREWRVAQEIATDELAVTATSTDVTTYARTLIDLIAQTPATTPQPPLAVALSEAYTQLARRMQAMQTFRPLTRRSRILAMSSVLTISLLSLIPWKLTAQEQRSEETSDPQPTEASSEQAPSDETNSQPARTMTIHVVDQDGQPVEGAKVFRNHIYKPDGLPLGAKPTRIENASYVTNAAGDATVTLSETSVDLRLWVRKEKFVPMFAMWAKDSQSDGDQIPEEFTFQLETGTTIGGVVTDQEGNPIEGVRVEVVDQTVDSWVNQHADEPGTRPVRDRYLTDRGEGVLTDANGRWTLNNVPADEIFESALGRAALHRPPSFEGKNFRTINMGLMTPINVKLSHPEFVDGSWDGSLLRPMLSWKSMRDGTAIFKMRSVNIISGGVTAPSGEPAVNAVVGMLSDTVPTSHQGEQTDEHGHYLLKTVVGKPQVLVAKSNESAIAITRTSPESEFSVLVRASPEKSITVDIELKPVQPIRMQFVDGRGKPLPEVRAVFYEWNGQRLARAQFPETLREQIPENADTDGRFAFDAAAAGDTLLFNFSKPGYRDVDRYSVIATDSVYTVTLIRDPKSSEKQTHTEGPEVHQERVPVFRREEF